ncbi:hypothetical protein AB8R50_29410, partial [Klebsiella pneumoniae subsp. ozaenae]
MFAGKKSAQIREILISESAWEEMTCLFAPSLGCTEPIAIAYAAAVAAKYLNAPILKITGNISENLYK